MNISSVVLVGTVTVVGAVTLNPIVLGVVSTSGLLIKTFSELKDYKKD